MLHFGTDGVRGVALEELTVELVRDLARAVARVLQPTGIVIGRDTRESGLALERSIIEGCASEGVAVHLLGVCPTPAIAFAAERYGWVGIAITASHNPWSDNGIKVFASGGHKLDDTEQIEIERVWHSLITDASPTSMGTVHEATHVIDEYIAHRNHVVGESLGGIKVVLDCANGAMSYVAPAAFRAASADVIVMADQPNGRNINDHCGATSPQLLAKKVVSEGADLGIAFDGDGDRVIAVSGSGNIIDGDYIMAIAAQDLSQRGLLRNKTVAVTVMTNLGFHRAMRDCDIDVIVTPVGDRSVLAALDEYDLVLGGEQSGHIIHRAHATTGDGVLAGLMLMEFLARTGVSLDEAASKMQSYPQVLVNVRTTERVHDPMSVLGDAVASIEKELGKDGRVLVRSSGTEPLVRVMVEASTDAVAQEKAMNLANILVGVYGGTIEGAH
jgi:phosphoglucosamine mutase